MRSRAVCCWLQDRTVKACQAASHTTTIIPSALGFQDHSQVGDPSALTRAYCSVRGSASVLAVCLAAGITDHSPCPHEQPAGIECVLHCSTHGLLSNAVQLCRVTAALFFLLSTLRAVCRLVLPYHVYHIAGARTSGTGAAAHSSAGHAPAVEQQRGMPIQPSGVRRSPSYQNYAAAAAAPPPQPQPQQTRSLSRASSISHLMGFSWWGVM